MKKRDIILIVLTIIIIAVLSYGAYYVNDYYHADVNVTSYMDDVNITNTSNGMLLDGPGNDTALIFYPGAKVEYTSYIPIFYQLSKRGIDTYLVEMPFNIAFLGQNMADEIIDSGNYSHYFIAGHSLGGVVASSYVNRTNNTDGLILLAAYPTEKIEKPVLSVYASNDEIFDRVAYNQSKALMDNLTEIVIKGGNHAQFGNYHSQTGDGTPKITSQKHQAKCVDCIVEFIDKIV